MSDRLTEKSKMLDGLNVHLGIFDEVQDFQATGSGRLTAEQLKEIEERAKISQAAAYNNPMFKGTYLQHLSFDVEKLLAEVKRLEAESADKERMYNEEYNLRKDFQRESKRLQAELDAAKVDSDDALDSFGEWRSRHER